ncbi:MAG: hypothetical protein R3C53_11030 [Pirellulaceae bacterium]
MLFSELSQQLYRAWAYLTTGRTLAVVFGVGFALLAVFLLIASRTKWGQAKPLTKCVVLSVLAHIWLLMYALGNRTVLPQGDARGREQNISVAFETFEEPAAPPAEPFDGDAPSRELQPWETPVPLADLPTSAAVDHLLSQTIAPPELPPLLESATPLPPLEDIVNDRESEPAEIEPPQIAVLTNLPPAVDPPATNSWPVAANPADLGGSDMNATQVTDIVEPTVMRPINSGPSPVLPPDRQLPPESKLPREYQLRQAPNRLQLAQAYGADADSEAAVEAALSWLAGAQSADGGWIAKHYGGGTETYALGEYRAGTGDRADTGISGLALLAFLSAGNTHVEGKYKHHVERGLRYLLDAQMPSGDLSGPKQVGADASVLNARMYCHSIATLALAEAYAMTRDAFLKDSLLRAAQYSINAQDPRGGGWRYKPGEPGDLSQFGWQAMALKSVERSGIEIPLDVQRRMQGFIDSCQTGTHGGLARYRPGEGRPSETMTAEALACRLLMNYPLSLPAQTEANRMIMEHRPQTNGDSQPENVYFWYYATLALFQQQNEDWRIWNQAMKARLLTTQVPAYGEQAGSWQPDGMWGGYGGRVYSTAMSCLCLEVYYRYLPMYQRANLARQPQPGALIK